MRKSDVNALSFRYRDWPELKQLIKRSGYSRVEIAIEMGITPSTLAQKLSGFARMTEEDANRIRILTQRGE